MSSKLNYRKYGAGKTNILLLHGWGGSINSLDKLAQALAAKDFTSWVVDLPGFGKSPKPESNWGLAEYANVINEFITTEISQPVVLFGHSFGGACGVKAATSYPQNVMSLILCNASGIRRSSMKSKLWKAISIPGKVLLSILPRQTREQLRKAIYRYIIRERDYVEANALTEVYRRVISTDITPLLSQINCPTLLIWGENDTQTPLWMGREMHELIKANKELVIIPDQKHDLPLTQPKLVADKVTGFLA